MGEEPLVDPFGTDFDLIEGLMKEPDVRIERRASDMRSYYQNEEAPEYIVHRGGWCMFLPFGRTDR